MSRTLPHHATALASHGVVRTVALVLTGVVALVGAGAAASWIDLQNQMKVSDVDTLLGRDADRPAVAAQDPTDPYAGKALNILVMGTDFRDEANAKIAGAGDEFHSDTTLLVHVSGDRSRIEAVSIPRDSLVDIPSCPLPGGGDTAPQSGAMFNTAFAIGGGADKDLTGAAACTIKTVEALTGVRVTDHVVVQMTGVIGVVDAIGGVTMCLPEPVVGDRRYSDLDLAAGRQTLDGNDAIDFLRVRKGTGMGLELGSDLKRIERQQAFFDATMREILSQNIITDSPRLYRMVREILGSISTSPGLGSPAALAGLAWSVRNLDPSRIVFTSVPVVDSVSQPGRVEWTADAAAVWERLRKDEPPPGMTSEPAEVTSAPSATAVDDEVASPGPGASDSPSPSGSAGTQEDDDGPSPSPSPSLLPGVCA